MAAFETALKAAEDVRNVLGCSENDSSVRVEEKNTQVLNDDGPESDDNDDDDEVPDEAYWRSRLKWLEVVRLNLQKRRQELRESFYEKYGQFPNSGRHAGEEPHTEEFGGSRNVEELTF